MIVLPVALIIEQPDLGTGMLVLVSGVIVLFMAGLGWGYIVTPRWRYRRGAGSCHVVVCHARLPTPAGADVV
jgi:hypothetical protein